MFCGYLWRARICNGWGGFISNAVIFVTCVADAAITGVDRGSCNILGREHNGFQDGKMKIIVFLKDLNDLIRFTGHMQKTMPSISLYMDFEQLKPFWDMSNFFTFLLCSVTGQIFEKIVIKYPINHL